jgi:hypothetical protein
MSHSTVKLYVAEDESELTSPPQLYVLSGGVGGKTGECKYQAPNGTIVSSTAPVYNNTTYYYMSYLFNGDTAGTSHDSYWLTSSQGPQQLDFEFPKSIYIDHIRVCATAYVSNASTDRRSNYSICVWDEKSGRWVDVTDLVDTKGDPLGWTRSHSVKRYAGKIKFHLTCEAKYGVTLKEIDFMVCQK